MKKERSEFPIRINKYLALEKISSRRGADELIKSGRILINGRLAVLGDKVAEGDVVEFRENSEKSEFKYFAFHKPINAESPSAKDEHGLFPIAPLEKFYSGLMILTNDGRITTAILNPSKEHLFEYEIETRDNLRDSFKENMEKGLNINGIMTNRCKVKVMDENNFKILISENMNRQIKKMCVALFNDVKFLKRTKILNIELGKLAPNSRRKIEGEELKVFLSMLGL